MNHPKPRTSLLLSAALATLLLAWSGVVSAAPFSASRVPAQADGVAHVDMDKLRASSLWQAILKQLPAEARAGAKKDVSKQILKALEDLGEDGLVAVAGSIMAATQSLTVWGDDNERWALIVELPQASTMMSLVKGAAKLKTSTKQGVTLYHLGDDAFLGVHRNLLIVSEHADAVVTTVRLQNGKGKSLASRKLGKVNASSKKGILFIAGFGGKLLETFKKSAASAALQADIRSVMLYVGESGTTFFAEAEAQVKSAAEASKLAAIATGLLGLASLGNDDPDVATLISGLTIKAKGATLHARLELSDKTVQKFIADQNKP
jgi:hypothetical protein